MTKRSMPAGLSRRARSCCPHCRHSVPHAAEPPSAHQPVDCSDDDSNNNHSSSSSSRPHGLGTYWMCLNCSDKLQSAIAGTDGTMEMRRFLTAREEECLTKRLQGCIVDIWREGQRWLHASSCMHMQHVAGAADRRCASGKCSTKDDMPMLCFSVLICSFQSKALA